MKKLLLFIVLTIFGLGLNAQSKSLKGFINISQILDFDTLIAVDGLKKTLHFFFITKKNYLCKI